MTNITLNKAVKLRNSGYIVDAGTHQLDVLVAGGEWSALYIDGNLAEYGDHYIVKEAIYAIVGVDEESDDSWYREVTFTVGEGRTARKRYKTEVAQTLEQRDAWKSEREVAAEKIAALKAEAAELESRYKL
jgi:hypothetical protein